MITKCITQSVLLSVRGELFRRGLPLSATPKVLEVVRVWFPTSEREVFLLRSLAGDHGGGSQTLFVPNFDLLKRLIEAVTEWSKLVRIDPNLKTR